MFKKLKILASLLLGVLLMSFAQPIFAFSSSGSDKWVAGQYNSGIKTTDSKGVIIRRLTNYTTNEKITVFCAEFGVDSSTGVIENAQHIVPTDPLMKTACKIAYFGWYSRYGEYAVDGGILTEGFNQVKTDYVFTQQMIWEVLGQSNATFIDENIQQQYLLFKNQINSNIDNMKTQPSFCNTTITVEIGEAITLTDTNGVLADYTSIDKTINGIRIVHNKGENTINIRVSNDCILENYTISEEIMKNWGLIKESSKDNDTTIFFQFEDGVQDQLYSMHYNDPVTMSLNLKINLLGNIELKKLDENGKLIDGAIFEVNGPENFSKEITVKNGKITLDKLKRGTYTIKEKTSPNGYLLNTQIYTVEVIANQTTTQAITNKEPTGTITILKKDSETGNKPQGDAKLENAFYKVYANEDIYNASKTKKFYSKGDLVATRITNSKGETEDITNLPLGRYLVKEDKAPIGYMLDKNEYEVNLIYKDQNTKLIAEKVTSMDKVKSMQVHIFKTGIGENSGLVSGLAGAEFSIKLNSDLEKAYKQGYTYSEIWKGINEYGNHVEVDLKRVEEAQKIAPNYDVITTDVNGNAYTQKKLPYGKYIVKETKIPKNFKGAEDFSFSITQDESQIEELAQKVKYLVVNNEQLATYIKLIKKDLKTGKKVTLSSSTFQIKATQDIRDISTGEIIYPKGEVIKQKIGNTLCSSFTTNADNIVIPENSYNNKNDEKGSVITPLELPAGNYEIIEIKPPKGFLQLQQPIALKIEDIKDINIDKQGNYIKEVVIKNEQPTGTLIVHKNITTRDDIDKSLIDITNLSTIKFKLMAKQDIIDAIDGSIIYKKGEIINIYNLDKKGNLKVEKLPIGIYELQEVKAVDGLVLNETKYEVKFTLENSVAKVYEEKKEIQNETTLVEIFKQDITTGKQLVGAKLSVLDEKNKTIDTWISDEKTHKIEGLAVGKTYILREEAAPEGYTIAEDVKFTIKNNKDIQKVIMKDNPILKTIQVIKVDSETKEMIKTNFKFGIYEDFECTKLIKEIEPEKESGIIIFDKLRFGTYYLKEINAPEGYLLSDKIIKIEINNKGIFADGELLKEENFTSTVTYYNSPIPVIQTGNERNYVFLLSSLVISMSGLIILISKNKFLKS